MQYDEISYKDESPSDKLARYRTIRKMINQATSEFLSESLYQGKEVREVDFKTVKNILARYLQRK